MENIKKDSSNISKKSSSSNNLPEITDKKRKLSHYLACINGPILFTAPHSSKLYRGGKDYGTKEIVHLRENYTSTLAIRWASEVGGSFCVWKKENVLNRLDVDPNYMQDDKKASSPFHQTFHAFQMKNKDKPLMHIDIHGKFNRKTNYELDLGIETLLVKWGNVDPDFCFAFTKVLTDNFNKTLVLAGEYNGFSAVCNSSPYLHGYWGCNNLYTMTEQGIDLGIPSFQLEIPNYMRTQLYKNKEFSSAFLGAIVDTYKTVVEPWWPVRTIKQICDEKIGKQLIEIDDNTKKNNCSSLVEIYEKWSSIPATEKII